MIENIIGIILIALPIPILYGIRTLTDDKYDNFWIGFVGILFVEIMVGMIVAGVFIIFK